MSFIPDEVPHTLYDAEGNKWTLKHYDFDRVMLSYFREDMECGLTLRPSEVETEFTRKGRPESKFEIVQQGKYECAAAALAMLLGESLFTVKRAMGKANWRNDNRGASNQVIIDAARYLGADLLHLQGHEIMDNIGPCELHLPSLNMKGMGHGVTWNGKQILDPQWGREGKKFWGTEWHPSTMGAWSALELLSFNLSKDERCLHDRLMRKREDDKLEKIRPPSFKKVVGME